MKSGPLLKAERIVKSFGGLRALDGASVEVRAGFFTLVAGPNGSGKTTLINVITGVLRQDEGRIFYRGRDISHTAPFERRRLGIVRTFQTPRVAQRLSVLDNVIMGVLQRETPKWWGWREAERKLADKAYEALKLVNLAHMWDRPAGELSGGQLKLLELARALVAEAEVILLDEPGAGLNPALARELFAALRAVAQRGVGVMAVEHRLDIALDYVDYAYFMHEGKVVVEGAPSEVFRHPLVAEVYLGQ